MRSWIQKIIFLTCGCVFSQSFVPFPEHYNRLIQGISFSPDGSILYCTLPHKERLSANVDTEINPVPRLAMYLSAKENNHWGKPILLPFSGVYKDYEPTISPNGNLLFFNSDRPLQGGHQVEKNNIWFSEFEEGTWKQPQPLKNINAVEREQSYPTISRTGKLIYSAEVGSEYLLFETLFTGPDTRPGKQIQFLDFNRSMGDPWLSPQGDYLIFTGFSVENWSGTCDLYISFYKTNRWTDPINLKELNTKGPDFSPAISPDGKWIYYRRNYEFVKLPFKRLLRSYRKLPWLFSMSKKYNFRARQWSKFLYSQTLLINEKC